MGTRAAMAFTAAPAPTVPAAATARLQERLQVSLPLQQQQQPRTGALQRPWPAAATTDIDCSWRGLRPTSGRPLQCRGRWRPGVQRRSRRFRCRGSGGEDEDRIPGRVEGCSSKAGSGWAPAAARAPAVPTSGQGAQCSPQLSDCCSGWGAGVEPAATDVAVWGGRDATDVDNTVSYVSSGRVWANG